MQAVGAGGQDRLPRGKHASELIRTAGGRRLDSGLVELQSLPELRHKEPGPDFSIWTRSGDSPGGTRGSSVGRHRRDAPELDALRASSLYGQGAPTSPIPWLTSEAVMQEDRVAAMPMPRSRRDAVRPAMNVALAPARHEETFSTATVAQGIRSDRVEKEIRDAVSYEKGLAVKGLVSIALVIAVLAARVHFFG
jgi:hypothetical protein